MMLLMVGIICIIVAVIIIIDIILIIWSVTYGTSAGLGPGGLKINK